MANISQITLPDGVTYDIKDASARQGLSGKLDSSLKGAANGIAELDSSGRVPSSQLPSYVDDVLEYVSIMSFPVTGETGKIYVDTSSNKTYRWGGSTYVEISSPGQQGALKFTNKTVSSWALMNSIDDDYIVKFPYRGSIQCAEVTSSNTAVVVFSTSDAESNQFSTVTNTGSDVVYIYAKDNSVYPTVPMIICL